MSRNDQQQGYVVQHPLPQEKLPSAAQLKSIFSHSCKFKGSISEHLKERGICSHKKTVTSSTKLICFQQIYQENLKIAEYPFHQSIGLDHLEIHIALSNLNIDVRILA